MQSHAKRERAGERTDLITESPEKAIAIADGVGGVEAQLAQLGAEVCGILCGIRRELWRELKRRAKETPTEAG